MAAGCCCWVRGEEEIYVTLKNTKTWVETKIGWHFRPSKSPTSNDFVSNFSGISMSGIWELFISCIRSQIDGRLNDSNLNRSRVTCKSFTTTMWKSSDDLWGWRSIINGKIESLSLGDMNCKFFKIFFHIPSDAMAREFSTFQHVSIFQARSDEKKNRKLKLGEDEKTRKPKSANDSSNNDRSLLMYAMKIV